MFLKLVVRIIKYSDIILNENKYGVHINLSEVKKEVITKQNYKNGTVGTLLAKSLVISGMGKAIVIAVGKNSLAGAITEKTQQKEED